jgi:predicted nuclease with TOPRIM domain
MLRLHSSKNYMHILELKRSKFGISQHKKLKLSTNAWFGLSLRTGRRDIVTLSKQISDFPTHKEEIQQEQDRLASELSPTQANLVVKEKNISDLTVQKSRKRTAVTNRRQNSNSLKRRL